MHYIGRDGVNRHICTYAGTVVWNKLLGNKLRLKSLQSAD